MTAPPDLQAAIKAAAQGDDRAKRYTDAWKEASEGRDRLVELLSRMGASEVERDDDGRAAVVQIVNHDTGEVWDLDGRMIREDWLAEPRRTAGSMERCSLEYSVILQSDGRYKTVPWGCTSPLCPVCARHKAASRAERWTPVLHSMVAELGCKVLHLTLTQPQDPAETLSASLARLKRAWSTLVDGRGSRAAWKRHVAGYLLGTEWTGKHPRTGARRWHPHFHVAVVCWPVMADTFEGFAVSRWCAITGASPAAQHVDKLGNERTTSEVVGEDGIDRVLREVLKYPFKPATLDDDQLAEVLVSTKGLRPHRPGGGFHGASRIGKLAKLRGLGELDAWQDWDRPPTTAELDASEAIHHGREEWAKDRAQPLYRDVGKPAVMDASSLEEDGPGHELNQRKLGDWMDTAGHLWRLLTWSALKRAHYVDQVMRLRTLDGEPFEARAAEVLQSVSSWNPRAPP